MLSFGALCSFMDALPTARCIVEGERIINSKFIVQCGKLNSVSREIDILGLVLQTSAMMEKPHEVLGTLYFVEEVLSIKKMKCSCKAGTRCKHIAAVLIYFTRNHLDSVELLSQTDVKRLWGIRKGPVLNQFSIKKISETECFGEMMAKVSLPTVGTDDDFFKELCACVPNAAQTINLQGRKRAITDAGTSTEVDHINFDSENQEEKIWQHIFQYFLDAPDGTDGMDLSSLPDCCQKQIEDLLLGDPLEICKITKASTVEWHNKRQFRITGSRCYSLFTYSKGDWQVKSSKYFWPKSFSNKFTQHGIKFEPLARNTYLSIFTDNEVIETGLIICKKFPWLAYSPDGIVLQNNKPVKLLEIKCPFMGSTSPITEVLPTLTFLKKDDHDMFVLKTRHTYYGQIQFGMALLNLSSCDFMIYASGDGSFSCINVPFDIEFATNMINKLNKIYVEQMIHNICINTN